jgi:hypothetical protein
MKDPQGAVFSFAIWNREITTLLPHVGRVMLGLAPKGKKGGEQLWVAWDDLLVTAADCLAPEPGVDPPRWRTVKWLEDAQIAALRARALGPSTKSD